MTESTAAILALILGLCAVIAVTVWWPNPLDRESPEESQWPDPALMRPEIRGAPDQ
ncbi:hypothetical protein [Nocardia neocaledoniensis]|uniref:hypothetical protein n=1 Tax=Nocardia neocaledoniensis TaxID=236511 RepID=UPI002454274C|nr:hypothetical protein [Nocardia neocaledoniensis]